MSSEKARRSSEKDIFGWRLRTLPDAGRWVDAFIQQYQLALDLADAMLAGVERIQSAQLEAAREFQAQNRRSADALAGVRDPQALMTAQGALASSQWQAAMRQLSAMAEIVQKTNLDCARVLEARCVHIGESWKDAAAIPQFGAVGMPAAWKSAFDAVRASSETMMRAFTGQGAWAQAAGRSEPHKVKAA